MKRRSAAACSPARSAARTRACRRNASTRCLCPSRASRRPTKSARCCGSRCARAWPDPARRTTQTPRSAPRPSPATGRSAVRDSSPRADRSDDAAAARHHGGAHTGCISTQQQDPHRLLSCDRPARFDPGGQHRHAARHGGQRRLRISAAAPTLHCQFLHGHAIRTWRASAWRKSRSFGGLLRISSTGIAVSPCASRP